MSTRRNLKKTIHMAATFTAEPILKGLDFWNNKLGLNLVPNILNYNQVFQELIDSSSLFSKNEEGINVILLRFEDWLPYKEENPYNYAKLSPERDEFQQLQQSLNSISEDFISALKNFQSHALCPTLLLICPSSSEFRHQEHWKLCFEKIEMHIGEQLNGIKSLYMMIAENFHERYKVDMIDDLFRYKMGHIPFVDEYYNFLSTLLIRYYYGIFTKGYKVILVDCDNTLWKGVCGEIAPKDIEMGGMYKEFQQFLVEQKNQGMLLCLCSKNVEEDVWKVFNNRPDFPLKKEFLADYRINWNSKSENLYSLSKSLNLGLDSFIFIDDNPVECAEVKANCPSVLTLQCPDNEEGMSNLIYHTWEFDHFNITEEDAKRTTMIQQNLARQNFMDEFTDFGDFIKKLELKVDILPMETKNLPRVSQLTERTNQFNFTTIRRNENKIQGLLKQDGYECRVVNVQDRFGEYGLVGVMIFLKDNQCLKLDSFMLSCRALGRGVEYKMISELGKIALENNLEYVQVLLIETEKNKPAAAFLQNIAAQLSAEVNNSIEKQIQYIFNAKGLSNLTFVQPSKATAKKSNAAIKTRKVQSKGSAISEDLRNLTTESKITQAIYGAFHKDKEQEFEVNPELSIEENIKEFITSFICRELNMERNKVKINKNIQDYGVDSILVMKLMREFEKYFHSKITRRNLIEYPTIKALALYLTKGIETGNMEEEAVNIPLSEMQRSFWTLQKMYPNMSAYNVPMCLKISRKIDVEIFSKACKFLLEQHPILNSVIREENGVPYQKLLPSQELDFTHENIAGLKSDEVIDFIRGKNKEPLSFEQGPLMRICLFTRSEMEHFVLITIHHIILDGTSQVLIAKKLLEEYNILEQGDKPEIKHSSVSYKDFVQWEQRLLEDKEGKEHLSYWRHKLSGQLPVLELPRDFTCSTGQSFQGEIYTTRLSKNISKKVKSYAASKHMNPSPVFLGVYKLLLNRYTGQEDIIVGMPVKGRSKEDFQDLVGLFINMVPIRSSVESSLSFNDYIQELQLTMADALDHSVYPFPAMVRNLNIPREQANTPVYQTVFAYQNYIRTGDFKDQVEFLEEVAQEGEYEFGLEIYEKEDGFVLNLKYSTELFKQETIEQAMGHYIRLLEVALDNPELDLSKYSMLSKKEEKRLLYDWNATQMEYPDKCFHQLFQLQAQKTPDAVGVVFEGESLTYRELDEKSTLLALYLQKQGVGRDFLVGICMERSLDIIIAILGILKSGGAYVPMDPDYPEERLEYMMEDSGASIVLTQSNLLNKLSQFIGNDVELLVIDRDWDDIVTEGKDRKELVQEVKGSDLAYVIYTSGSTGKPKGVMIPHKALTNFLITMMDKPGINSKDRLLAVTTFCFDIAGLELYLPLICGAKCFICSAEKTKDAEKLKGEIQRIKPTIMQATPVTWKMLFQVGWKNEEKVKILCGGEALPEKLKKSFVDTDSDVWNVFGPTETTIWSLLEHIKAKENITIGNPIGNTQVYIIDKNLQPTPVGIAGELCIAGDGLARGYLNKPELTAEKFIDNPFNNGTKLYRTGDLARWLSDGRVDFIGRIDNQVKIHGFRIELDDIETHLSTYPGISECVVVVKEDEGNKQLVAYYIRNNSMSTNEEPIDPNKLREYLKPKLPEYMLPAFFINIDKMPLTPNGKIDRKELVSRKILFAKTKKINIPKSKIEEKLLEIWKDILKVDDIGIEDGFFVVGGDSYLALVVTESIKRNLQCDISVTDLFKYSNIKALGEYISEIKSTQEVPLGEENKSETINSNDNKEYPDYYKDSMAIIGISCCFPDAKNHYEFWNNLKEGKESVRVFSPKELNIPEEIAGNSNYIPVQATIEGKDFFDPGFFGISHRDAKLMDPQLRLLLQHSWKAVEDAGYVSKDIPETSVFMSASNSCYYSLLPSFSSETVGITRNSNEYVSWLFAQGGSIPTMVSHKLGLKGPSFFIHSNCSSSLSVLYSAYNSLYSGESKHALIGASTIFPGRNFGYVHQPGLNFSSNGHCKAFDAGADGMVGGEGVAALLLKKAEDAIADGDHIYALIRGISLNNDGADKVGFYAPSVKGQSEVIRKVLDSKNIDPETISYIEAHGTGTALGDPIEITALRDAYASYTAKKQFCGVGSVKPNIGHLDTAAGLAGCIKVALSLYYGEIPPTINYKEPNPNINFKDSPFYVVDSLRKLDKTMYPSRAGLTSLGIGGTNAHAVFEQYKTKPVNKAEAVNNEVLVPLSAKNKDRLAEYALELFNWIESQKENQGSVEDIAYTLQVGREPLESRVAFIVKDIEELKQKLKAFLDGRENIMGVFKGDLKQSKDFVKLFEEDEKYKAQISKWIKDKNLEKIAEIWSKGFKMNWKLLNSGTSLRRISLPTYPFAQESYWGIENDIENLIYSEAGDNVQKPDTNTSPLTTQRPLQAIVSNETYCKETVYKPSGISLANISDIQPSSSELEIHQGSLKKELRASLAKVLDVTEGDLDDDMNFIDMGLDSIIGVEWIHDMNKHFSTSITTTKIYDYSTINKFAEFLGNELSKQNHKPAQELVQTNPINRSLQKELTEKLAMVLDMDLEEIDSDTKFVDMGLDSIIGVEWVRGINDAYGTSVAATKVYDYPTIREFAAFIEKELSKQQPKSGLPDISLEFMAPQPVVSKSNISIKKEECNVEQISSRTEAVVDWHEIEPGIVLVTMQDKVSKNGFSNELTTGLIRAFEAIKGQPNYKIVILTGYDSYFASGGTKDGLMDIYQGKKKFTDTNIYGLALNCDIPVIAAMQGHGIGAGWSIGMFCDFIVMSKESVYASNYMKLGFTPGAGATLVFPEKLGISLAQEILFTGKSFKGAELEARGIPFPVLPRKEVLPYALKLARDLAESPRESLVALKERMSEIIREKLSGAYEKELKMHERTFVNQPEVMERIQNLFGEQPNNLNTGKSEAIKVVSKKPAVSPKMEITDDAIAIIGVSGQFPKASHIGEFWDNLAKGRNCISEVPINRWSLEKYYCEDQDAPGKTYSKWMGSLENADKFDPLFFNISPAEAELMDPQQRVFLENCWSCVEDAGLSQSMLSESRCGVFVGCGTGDYGQFTDEESLNAQSFMGNSVAILSARIAYLLNLKGPCMAIDTACSSSLVAIAEACNSLVLKNSDIALAGGVSIMSGPSMHIMTSKSGMLSKDGKCFTFDNRANGFVPGEGVGVLLLKRLKDAVRDQDNIYGLIRGWGVNQDGKTNGITAPSVNSQILLEKDVFKRFGINPETITMVEAHGTGTKLGDPIEVEALTEAFRSQTQNKNYCALGSVKTNIGHLLAAAGVAGVIKVLLSLKHQMLPPTINYETLNEHISLENSPFFINTKLRPWESAFSYPRRGSVSSFGFSGTNSYIVLEEYNKDKYEAKSEVMVNANNPVLCVLSAKSEEQLKNYAENIKIYIEEQKEINLNDLTYTLQVGREPMDYRMAVLAQSKENLIEALNKFAKGLKSEEILTGQARKNKDEVAAFEDDEDALMLLQAWIQKKKLRKIGELWVKGLQIDWNKLYGDVKPRRISAPTYPLSRESYWAPKASPEPVEVCVTTKSYIHPLLQRNTSNFSQLRFSSCFSGKEFFLKDHVLKGEKVIPGVAHLEMAQEAIKQGLDISKDSNVSICLKNVVWLKPIIVEENDVQVHIRLMPEENGEIGYEIYGTQADSNEEVVYSQGTAVISSVIEDEYVDVKAAQLQCDKTRIPGATFYNFYKSGGLELGPALRGIEEVYIGEGLGLVKLSLPESVSDTMTQFSLHPSIMDSMLQSLVCLTTELNSTDFKLSIPFAMGQLEILDKCTANMWALIRYSEGSKVGDKVLKFEVDLCDQEGKVCLHVKGYSARVFQGELNSANEESIMMTPVWDPVSIEEKHSLAPLEENIVIVGERGNSLSKLTDYCPNATILELAQGDNIEEIAGKLKGIGMIRNIIWAAPQNVTKNLTDNRFVEEQDKGVLQVFRIIKALLRLGYGNKKLGWSLITVQAEGINKNDLVDPTHAGIHGLAGCMAKEYPDWSIRLVDMEADNDCPIGDIFKLTEDQKGNPWAYRGGVWYKQKLIVINCPPNNQGSYRKNGVYVVIGGAGGIGEAWSEYMIRTYQAQIIWIGRRIIDEVIQSKIDRLAAIGKEPVYVTADAANPVELKEAYNRIKQIFPKINGVIHSAMVLLDQSLENMSEERFKASLSSKVDVSVRIAQIFENEPLDFILFFSSMISFTKAEGQSNYAAGSTFQDAFAKWLSMKMDCAVKVINWGYWGNTGVVASKAYKERMSDLGIGSIEASEGMEALELLLAAPVNQMGFMKKYRQGV